MGEKSYKIVVSFVKRICDHSLCVAQNQVMGDTAQRAHRWSMNNCAPWVEVSILPMWTENHGHVVTSSK